MWRKIDGLVMKGRRLRASPDTTPRDQQSSRWRWSCWCAMGKRLINSISPRPWQRDCTVDASCPKDGARSGWPRLQVSTGRPARSSSTPTSSPGSAVTRILTRSRPPLVMPSTSVATTMRGTAPSLVGRWLSRAGPGGADHFWSDRAESALSCFMARPRCSS
jgi:hypothetical protein